MKLKRFKLYLLLLLLTASCSSVDFIKAYSSLDTSKNFKDNIFIKEDITYIVGDLNHGWELIDMEYGDLAYYNKSWNSTININSTCKRSKDYSYVLLSDSLLTGLQNKKLIERSVTTVNREDALESKYYGEYESNRVKISVVVYKHDFCIYDFSYVSSEW